MMKLSTQPYRGMRDFYPEDQRVQDYIFDIWSKACQSFGYEHYNAPIIEPTELYAGKTSDEIVNEQTYTFKDRGDRSVTLRTEMTPSVARMVAARSQELGLPLRLFSIPNCFRYERPQKGRLREFWQLNVDLFGITTIDAELEMITLSDSILQAFGATAEMYKIRINSRRLTNLLMQDWLGLDGDRSASMIRLLDKKDKMSGEELLVQVSQITEEIDKIKQLLATKSLTDLPAEILESEAVQEVRQLFTMLKERGLTDRVTFDISLMRGFDYYTDIVFEVFDTDPDNNRALMGGGRYNDLMSIFGVAPIASIGFGAGDVSMREFLIAHDLLPDLQSSADIYLVTIGDNLRASQDVARQLRQSGVNVAVDISRRKADKQIKTALKQGAPQLLIIGDDEVENKKYILRDVATQDERTLNLDAIKQKLLS